MATVTGDKVEKQELAGVYVICGQYCLGYGNRGSRQMVSLMIFYIQQMDILPCLLMEITNIHNSNMQLCILENAEQSVKEDFVAITERKC